MRDNSSTRNSTASTGSRRARRTASAWPAARTPDEMRRHAELMVGDLNASHLGVTGPAGGAASIGRLGVRFDREAYEAGGQLRVTA